MKRDPHLRALSHDHHRALVLARRAALAATDGDPDGVRAAWAEVQHKFELELAPHFEIEERHLLPAMTAAGDDDLVDRVAREHRAIRELVASGGGDLESRLTEFGALVTDHVRFEERVLFPAAEARLAPATLEAVARASMPSHDEGKS